MVKTKKILLIIIIMVLFAPLMQQVFKVFDFKPLEGIKTEAPRPHFSLANFIDVAFQDSLDKYLNEHIGFRSGLIRIQNQLQYSLFKESKSPGVIVGKGGQFFIESYIENYTGRYFIGEKEIADNARKIQAIQNTFKQKFNVDLLIIFAPGKASFYPEFIPNRFKAIKYPNTHYLSYLAEFKKRQINFLDLNKYFLSLKNKSPYLLYPKYGTHWTSYGVALGADTIIKYIEKLRGIDMPEINYDKMEWSDTMRNTDYDIGVLLNTLQNFKPDSMPYVKYAFINDSTKTKPNVLAIGDSYWWSIVQAEIPKNVFKEDVYWNYGKELYINNVNQHKAVKDLDLKSEIENRDVIVIMATEATYGTFPFRFIDNAYLRYVASREEKIDYWYKTIQLIPEWLDKIKKDAEKRNENLDKLIKESAIWWVDQGN